MQTIELNVDHFNFYCPVTGVKISGADSEDQSPALLLAHCDEFDQIIYADTGISQQLHGLGIDHEAGSLEKNDIDNLKFPPETVCYRITVHGFSCGPVAISARYFINMNYYEEHEWN